VRRWTPRRTFFAKIFISVTIILVMLVLVLSSVMYVFVEGVVSHTVEDANRSNLAQISYSADYMDESAKNLAFSIFKDPNTATFMYQDSVETADVIWEREQLSIWARSNPLVYSIYLYNGKTNSFISSYTYPWEQKSGLPDKGIVEILRNIGQEPRKLKPIPREIQIDVAELKQMEVDVFTYVLYDFVSEDGQLEGAIIININADYLRSTIRTLASKSDKTRGNIAILDQTGNLIMDSEGSSEQNWAIDSQKWNEMLSSPMQSKEMTIGDKRMLATSVASDKLDWKYINLIPYDIIYEPLASIKRMTIWICSIILVVGISLTYFVSRKIYFPIRELVHKVKELTKNPHEADETNNEMAYLTDRFSSTFQQAVSLNLKQQQRRKQETLHNLLLTQDAMKFETVFKIISTYDIRLDPSKSYCLLFIQIDDYRNFAQRYTPKDQMLFRYALLKGLEEVLESYYCCEVADVGEDRIVAVINLEEKDNREQLECQLKGMLEWSLKHLRLSFTSTIGEVSDEMQRLNDAYREVVQLAKYRFLLGHGRIITRNEVTMNFNTSFQVPIPMMEKLLELLASGNGSGANEQFRVIMVNAKTGSYTSMISILHFMTYRINQKISALEQNTPLHFQIDFNDFTAKINGAETIDEVSAQFEFLFTTIEQVIVSKAKSRSQIVIEAVAKHIEDHYADQNLSLQSIAEEVKLSKMYLGQIFRESMGQSVSDYITEVRIQQVLRLMQHNNRSVSDILDQVGIENKNYFYKQFKKKIGVSLSDYKLKHLQKSEAIQETFH